MANTFNPFGLKAKHSPSGIVRPQRWVIPAASVISSAPSANIYQDDAVYIDNNGFLAVAGAATACVGSFQGVEYNDSTGRRTVSNQFNKNLVSNSTANNGLGTNDVWFWIYTDPNLVYEIMLAGNAQGGTVSGGTFALEGNLVSYNAGSGQSATTGFSTGFGTTTTGTAPFIIYNYAYDNNPQTTYVTGNPVSIGGASSWSDSYPTVLVRLANAQFTSSVSGF